MSDPAKNTDDSELSILTKNPKVVLLIITIVCGSSTGVNFMKGTDPELKKNIVEIHQNVIGLGTEQAIMRSDITHIKDDVQENKEDIKDMAKGK